eukprot:436750-Rhodomonas_salina.3
MAAKGQLMLCSADVSQLPGSSGCVNRNPQSFPTEFQVIITANCHSASHTSSASANQIRRVSNIPNPHTQKKLPGQSTRENSIWAETEEGLGRSATTDCFGA